MLEHSLTVLENCERAADVGFKQKVADAIEQMRKGRADNLSDDTEL